MIVILFMKSDNADRQWNKESVHDVTKLLEEIIIIYIIELDIKEFLTTKYKHS